MCLTASLSQQPKAAAALTEAEDAVEELGRLLLGKAGMLKVTESFSETLYKRGIKGLFPSSSFQQQF